MKAEIYTFGNFEIYVDGTDILREFQSSKKKLTLMQYLIVNMKRDIQIQELYDVLWPNGENTNPESALKTLVSRLRTNLEQLGMKGAIVTRKRLYKWNERLSPEIDMYKFDSLWEEVKDTPKLTTVIQKKFEKILALYRSELLSAQVRDGWIVEKRNEYHNRYLDAVKKYIELLNENGSYDDVVRVAKTGLEHDTLDAGLHLSVMNALLMLGKKNEAFMQYSHAANIGQLSSDKEPSDNMLEFYKRLIMNDVKTDSDISSIINELCDYERSDDKAYVCDYAIFKNIYKLTARTLKRHGTGIYLALISLEYTAVRNVDAILLEENMNILTHTLSNGLRKGDIITRYSVNQFAVLLPGVNAETGSIALERIKNDYYKNITSPDFIVKYRLKPIVGDNK